MSLDDAAQLIEYGKPIGIALIALAVAVALFRSRGARQSLADHDAQQRAIAATLGFRTPLLDPAQGIVASLKARISDGTEKLGRFQRLAGRSTIQVLFEGERDGIQMTLFLHTLSTEAEGNDTSTIACCASPSIDVPPFGLSPRVKSIFGGRADGVAFPSRPKFAELYTLESTYAVRIQDAFAPRVLDFFENNPGWSVEGLNDRLLVWRENVMEPDARIPAFVAEAAAVAGAFRKSA